MNGSGRMALGTAAVAAALATPEAAACQVTGLTVPGEYVFKAEARDREHSAVKELRVAVSKGGEP